MSSQGGADLRGAVLANQLNMGWCNPWMPNRYISARRAVGTGMITADCSIPPTSKWWKTGVFIGNCDRNDYRISKDGPKGELCKSAMGVLNVQLIGLYTATWGQKSGNGALLRQADWDTATSRNWKQKLRKFKNVFWFLVCQVDFDGNNLLTLILLSLTAHFKMKIWCFSKMQVCCS